MRVVRGVFRNPSCGASSSLSRHQLAVGERLTAGQATIAQ